MSNGYLQYRASETDEAEDDATASAGQGGSFSVMARDPAPAAGRTETATPPPAPARPPTVATPAPVAATQTTTNAEAPRCLEEQALLAQRLLQIRGIYVDPATALVTLPQLEVPLSPVIVRTFMGTPRPFIGGTLLGSAISFDTPTQQLTHQLAKCLLQ